MKLYLNGHEERYAVEQIQLALFPGEPMEPADRRNFEGDGAISSLFRGDHWLTATTRIRWHGRSEYAAQRIHTSEETVRLRRQILQRSYYLAAIRLLPQLPPWGALSGVRPTKLTTRHLLEGGSADSARELLRDTYFVSPARRDLCIDASLTTIRAMGHLRPDDVSLYVGIPFCPTRCTYCSFVSQAIERHGGLLEEYLACLLREVRHVGRRLRQYGRCVRTVYFGGGTPTTLSASQLARLMDAIAESFDLRDAIEYTVEAGRPDTLDPEKLRTLRAHGCDRISINPQTMNDSVLRAIGRCHTAAEAAAAFRAAREAGFENINMDLIAGLPGDTAAEFARSLRRVAALGPENITVHTLAIKRGSALAQEPASLPTAQAVAAMLTDAASALRKGGFAPYYLYRQKYMSGSFENVGWTRPGFEGLYNIYMMEELHDIISLGGGGMSKFLLPDGSLERQHNPKAPQQYIARIGEILAQKDAAFAEYWDEL